MKKPVIAAAALALAFVTAAPAQGASLPRLSNLSTSNRNLSYKTVSAVLGALKPGQSVTARSYYSPCSGTTVVAIDSGPPVTKAQCTWFGMADGHVYTVLTRW